MPWLHRAASVLCSTARNGSSLLSTSTLNGVRAISTAAQAQAGPEDSSFSWVSPYPGWWSHQKPEADAYCRQRKVIALGNRVPAIAACAYIAPSAVVVGDVDIMDGVRLPAAHHVLSMQSS